FAEIRGGRVEVRRKPDLALRRSWLAVITPAHLFQIPADERVDVVFLALRQRTRHITDRIDAVLLPLADFPILLVSERPEWQQPVQLVIVAFARVFVD